MSVLAPIDYHSRSASVSSNSSSSRPPSAHEDHIYHPQFANPSTSDYTHSRHSSSASTKYSLASTAITTPADSPPNGIPALKNQMAARTPHLRHVVRAAASPYTRDAHSQSGSEAEQDDLALYLSSTTSQQQQQQQHRPPQHPPSSQHPHAQQHSAEYSGLFIASQIPSHHPHPHQHHSIHQQQHPQHGHHPHSQDAAAAAVSFGRMSLSADMTLEHLASNVRSATTTSASDRAKQIFVQAWLSANYATYPDGNVPRQGLYFSYRKVCEQYQIPHINTATLGKAIRLCFPTIKTRRLGVRGNSKYHYCGIRPATATEAEWLQDYIRRTNNHAGLSSTNLPVRASNLLQNSTQQPYAREGSRSDPEDDEEDGGNSEGASSSNGHGKSLHPLQTNKATLATSLTLPVKSPTLYSMDISDKTPTTHSLQQQVCARPDSSTYGATPAQIRRRSQGPPAPVANQFASNSTPPQIHSSVPSAQFPNHHTPVRNLPGFPNIEDAVGSNSSSPQGLLAREVWRWFEGHLDSLLESIRNFRIDQFEVNIRSFWSGLSVDHKEVVHAPAVAGLMARADALVYDEILEILRLQVLTPIPSHVLASLRQLADKMEKILLFALGNYGPTFVEPKVELGARFGHLVLRFLDIFQVSQALATVLSNPKQLEDMRQSWSNIDFESVRNQAALVCNCRHEDLLQLLEVDFVKMMDSLVTTPEPVRTVMVWADECCERLMGMNGLGRGHGMGIEDRGSTMSSRSILIRWGYVTSQIMRDLTIRSDPAFGAFQILKLFLDDWIALNVLRSVALSTNSVQASVEPVVQQAFFSLSPMAGQETFSHSLDRPPSHHGSSDGPDSGSGNGGPHSISHHPAHPHLAHTPTTSSMLAVLNDPFPSSSLDSAPGSFDPSSYTAGLSYMDASPTHHSAGAGSTNAFGDFVSAPDNAFEVDVSGMEVGVIEVDVEAAVTSFATPQDLSGIGSSSVTNGNNSSATRTTSSPSVSENSVKKEGTQ